MLFFALNIFTPSAPNTKLKSMYFIFFVWSPKITTGFETLNKSFSSSQYPFI
jgi:hypothetical protein